MSSAVQEIKSTFSGIMSDVTGVMSIGITIGVFTIMIPMLMQMQGVMKGFQSYFYSQPKTVTQTQAKVK